MPVSGPVLVEFLTVTGSSRWVRVPSPSWALELSPQHLALPSVICAHVYREPATMCAMPVSGPVLVEFLTTTGCSF